MYVIAIWVCHNFKIRASELLTWSTPIVHCVTIIWWRRLVSSVLLQKGFGLMCIMVSVRLGVSDRIN